MTRALGWGGSWQRERGTCQDLVEHATRAGPSGEQKAVGIGCTWRRRDLLRELQGYGGEKREKRFGCSLRGGMPCNLLESYSKLVASRLCMLR
jgi:hypothetical protein